MVLTLPPQIALKIGQVIAQLRADVPAVVRRALDGARQAAYKGGALKNYFPDLDKPLEPDLTTALTMALDKIADASGLSRAQPDEAVTRRREELAATTRRAGRRRWRGRVPHRGRGAAHGAAARVAGGFG